MNNRFRNYNFDNLTIYLIALILFSSPIFSQIKIHPTNKVYVDFHKEEVLLNVDNMGYIAYKQILSDEAELSEKEILSKKSYFKQLSLLAVMLEKEWSRFEMHEELLLKPYHLYEEEKVKELNDFKENVIFSRNDFVELKIRRLFSVDDIMPTFKECNSFSENNLRYKCIHEGVQRFIQKEYPIDRIKRIIKKSDLEVKNKTFSTNVEFLVSKDGIVEWAKANSHNQKINTITEDLFLSLPKMIPGKIEGIPIKVKLSIPVNVYLN